MRVAFDARYLDGQGSGVGTYTLNLIRAMLRAEEDLELLLIRRSRRPLPALEALDRRRLGELYFPFPANSPPTRLLLGPLLSRERFDLYHAPFPVAPRALGRPVVVTIHDIMWIVNPRFNSRSRLLRLLAGPFYRASLETCLADAARVLTVSEATRRAIVEHSPWFASKLRVTPNGIDREKLRPMTREEVARELAPHLGAETPFVLTIGDASPHKNHRNAVRGFMRAFGSRPEWRMVLVRRFLRVDPEMRALLHEKAVRARVITLPHVPDRTLNALYRAARIYLQPSYYEGFGIPILEAMEAGVPVVTSTTSCLPEVAGDAALYADPADPDAIAAALRRLADDPALVDELRARGRRRLDHFTWEACAAKTLAAYREAVEGV